MNQFAVTRTRFPDVLLFTPRLFNDERGFFFEAFNRRSFVELTGTDVDFVQDNQSLSKLGVLRGLHYQVGRDAQGKLVRVLQGEIWDVVVDLRRRSPTFGKWSSFTLSSSNKHMVWIPPGFGHGFLVTDGPAEVLYKTTTYYAPESERTVVWNDPDLGIAWPLHKTPIVSAKDQNGSKLIEAELFP